MFLIPTVNNDLQAYILFYEHKEPTLLATSKAS